MDCGMQAAAADPAVPQDLVVLHSTGSNRRRPPVTADIQDAPSMSYKPWVAAASYAQERVWLASQVARDVPV